MATLAGAWPGQRQDSGTVLRSPVGVQHSVPQILEQVGDIKRNHTLIIPFIVSSSFTSVVTLFIMTST